MVSDYAHLNLEGGDGTISILFPTWISHIELKEIPSSLVNSSMFRDLIKSQKSFVIPGSLVLT